MNCFIIFSFPLLQLAIELNSDKVGHPVFTIAKKPCFKIGITGLQVQREACTGIFWSHRFLDRLASNGQAYFFNGEIVFIHFFAADAKGQVGIQGIARQSNGVTALRGDGYFVGAMCLEQDFWA